MRAPLSKVPCLLLLTGLLCGILTTVYASGSPTAIWSVTGGSLFVAALLVWRGKVILALAAAFIAIGALSTGNAVPAAPPESLTDGQKHTLRGCALATFGGERGQRAMLEVWSGDGKWVRPFRMMLSVGDIVPLVRAGDTLEVRCALESIPFGNEHEGTWELWSYSNFYARGIGSQGYAPGGAVRIGGQSHGLRFMPARLAEGVTRAVAHSGLSNEAQGVLLSTTLGKKHMTSSGMREKFTALGIAHLLCVSGYHVGLVAWLVVLSFRPLRVWRRWGKWSKVASALIVWGYVMLCGAEPAAVRAGIMISIYLLANIIEEDVQPFNSLWAASIIILVYNPFNLFTGGFLLSVSAVAGILLFMEPLNPFEMRKHRRHLAAETVLLPICAVLGTLPATLIMFHSFPIYFLPVNMASALLFPVFLVAACGGVMLWQAGIHAAWVSAPANWMTEGAMRLFERIAQTDTTIDNIYIAPAGIWMTALALIILASALRVRHRRIKGALLLMSVLCGVMGLTLRAAPPDGVRLYAWTENGKACVALQKGEEVEIFSEADKDVTAMVEKFLRERGAINIVRDAGSKGLPRNVIHIKSREKREAGEIVRPHTRYALLSSEMEPERKSEYRRELERRGIVCQELRPGAISELRRRRPSEK